MSKSLFTLCWLLLLVSLAPAGIEAEAAEPVSNQSQNETTGSGVSLSQLIFDSSEHFSDINSAKLDGLLQRIGDSRVVLLGESSHGTYEFYEMRARITRELIENKGFNIVAIEGDWPDASRIDFYVRGGRESGKRPMYTKKPFTVFPEWMWRNHSVMDFTHWLKDHNRSVRSADDTVGFYGIDIYNIFGSIDVVVDYLYGVDANMADFARRQYGCLAPWAEYPPDYGRALKSGKARPCTNEVAAVFQALQGKQAKFMPLDKQRYFHALQNARLIKNGERYFRTMKDGDTQSWNQRDNNMFERLQAIMDYRGETSKAVVWAHNTHLGDSRATDSRERGEVNLGQLVRQAFGDRSYIIGFGTDHGRVAAAPQWHRPVESRVVPASHKDSYEYLFHLVKADNFMLPLRHAKNDLIRKKLLPVRMERAIGVAYDPENELKKHYYDASLPRQFDEYIFFDETHAIRPLSE